MARKILSVIESAYRCTVEEQDDPALWLTQVVKGAGAEVTVLLRGAAVNYAVKGQDASGLAFGERKQTQPPRLADDVSKLLSKGCDVYFVQDDAAERGLEGSDFVPGLKGVSRAGLARLFAQYDQIWHW